MIEGCNSVVNSLLGTLLTWGLTAAGAALVFVLPPGEHRALLDASLGFAAGVMMAASFWSLLGPSIEKSEQLGYAWVWLPAAVGFLAGGAGIALTERFLPEDADDLLQFHNGVGSNGNGAVPHTNGRSNGAAHGAAAPGPSHRGSDRARSVSVSSDEDDESYDNAKASKLLAQQMERRRSTRRILLLVLAITVHNFPEGLAVGVGFGAVDAGAMSLNEARALAWGIGLQNFPEGLAVSMPLYRQGLGRWRSFWLGQLSGAVEPIAGVLGALLVRIADPVLPYALGFAAGAMIYVVVDDLIPEVAANGHSKESASGGAATWGCMVGFVVMMVLDVALG